MCDSHATAPSTEVSTLLSAFRDGTAENAFTRYRRSRSAADAGARGDREERRRTAEDEGADRDRAADGVPTLSGHRYATIGELRASLTAREISAVELADEVCDLLEQVGPRYNAVAMVTRTRARREAMRADAALRRGDKRPLLGVPYGAKDLLAAKGAPTTWGAPPFRDQTFDSDATAIRKLDRAGAVLAAKLAMVELAGGGGYRYPSASLQGPGLNPWNTERWSG
ncbi:MAG: hypothetical protein E6J52_08585, partial [Chloroflexi bacterium]